MRLLVAFVISFAVAVGIAEHVSATVNGVMSEARDRLHAVVEVMP